MNFVRELAVVAIWLPIDSDLMTFLEHCQHQWDSERSLQHSDCWHR